MNFVNEKAAGEDIRTEELEQVTGGIAPIIIGAAMGYAFMIGFAREYKE